MSFIKRYKIEILCIVLFFVSRLPSLGHDTFNTDVWKWKARSYDFGTGIFEFKPEKTLQKYHPGVTLMWLGTAGIKVNNVIAETYKIDEISDIFLLNKIQKIFVVAAISVSLFFSLYVLKNLFGSRLTLIFFSLVLLEPFYIALTREFHLEGLLSMFMLTSVLWFYHYIEKGGKKSLVISAIFGALSVLTKTSALFLIPFIGLISLLRYKKNIRAVSLDLLFWIVPMVSVCLLLWPALWYMPIQVFQALYKGIYTVGIDTDHFQYYFGKYVDSPGFFYYFVVFALRASILTSVGFIVSPFLYKFYSQDKRKFFGYLALFVFFYFLQITIPTKKLDRYIMPLLMIALIMTSVAIDYLIDKFLPKYRLAVLFAAFLPNLVVIPRIHYDYFSYYNPLLGGLRTGAFILEPKWMIGTREIIAYFKDLQAKQQLHVSEGESFEEIVDNKKVDSVLTVGFPEKYYTQIWPFFREIKGWAVIQDLTPFAVKTKYFVYPVWADEAPKENRFVLKYLDTIKVRGVPIYNVYVRI